MTRGRQDTVGKAKLVMEGDLVLFPIDCGVVLLQPINAQNNWVRVKLSDVERDIFRVVANGELESGLMGDGTMETGVSISHIQLDRVGKRRGRDREFGDIGGINKRFFSSRVNEGMS